jgi:hypothetical protein
VDAIAEFQKALQIPNQPVISVFRGSNKWRPVMRVLPFSDFLI